jgi:hypothetical protein
MTHVSSAYARVHSRARLGVSDWADVGLAVVTFAAFSLNFGAYRVFGDGDEYFSFVQRLFGDRATGSGYNFGTGLMNAPFYAAAKAAQVGVGTTSTVGRHALEASITFASIAYVATAMIATAWLIRRLGLAWSGFAVAAAVFGSPLWYYASFSPSYTHAADAAAFSAALACLYQALTANDPRWLTACAALLGLDVAVRPFNVGVVAGACVAFLALRRLRDAVVLGLVSAAAFGLLLIVPLVLGTGLRERASGVRVAGGDGVIGFAPLTPLRMLLSEHRGLFIWTPATLVGVIGFLIMLRRRPDARPFLVVLGAMAVGLLLTHTALLWWDGGWSFSMRYLSSLLPLYAIGIAAALESAGRRRPLVGLAVTACVLWSIYLGMNHAFGASQHDGALALATKRSPTTFAERAWAYSRVRHVVQRVLP